MTSETPNLHVSKNLNISKTKQDIEKLKTPLRLVWKCCSVVFKIGSKICSLQWHFKFTHEKPGNNKLLNRYLHMHCCVLLKFCYRNIRLVTRLSEQL